MIALVSEYLEASPYTLCDLLCLLVVGGYHLTTPLHIFRTRPFHLNNFTIRPLLLFTSLQQQDYF